MREGGMRDGGSGKNENEITRRPKKQNGDWRWGGFRIDCTQKDETRSRRSYKKSVKKGGESHDHHADDRGWPFRGRTKAAEQRPGAMTRRYKTRGKYGNGEKNAARKKG